MMQPYFLPVSGPSHLISRATSISTKCLLKCNASSVCFDMPLIFQEDHGFSSTLLP